MNDLEKVMEMEGYYIEQTNQCPKCKSKRISKLNTYQILEEINLSSEKRLSKSKLSPYSRMFHNYLCRKCGWQSITFDE